MVEEAAVLHDEPRGVPGDDAVGGVGVEDTAFDQSSGVLTQPQAGAAPDINGSAQVTEVFKCVIDADTVQSQVDVAEHRYEVTWHFGDVGYVQVAELVTRRALVTGK